MNFGICLVVLGLSLASLAQEPGASTSKIKVTSGGSANQSTADVTSPQVPAVEIENTKIKAYATRDLITSSTQKVKYSFFSLASMRVPDAEKGGSSLGAYNYLGVSYKLDQNDQIGFRYVFFYDSAGYKFNPSRFKEEYTGHSLEMGDPYFSFSRYSLAAWDEWNLSTSTRLYLPLSQYSQMQKMITQLRAEFFLDRGLLKYSNFNYTAKVDYFVQSQKAFQDQDVPRREDGTYPRNAVKTTKQASLEHYIEIDGNFHKKFSLKPRVGFEENWYYSSAEENLDSRHESDLKTQLGLEYRPAKRMSFTFAVENKVAMKNRKTDIEYFQRDDNKYMLISYIGL